MKGPIFCILFTLLLFSTIGTALKVEPTMVQKQAIPGDKLVLNFTIKGDSATEETTPPTWTGTDIYTWSKAIVAPTDFSVTNMTTQSILAIITVPTSQESGDYFGWIGNSLIWITIAGQPASQWETSDSFFFSPGVYGKKIVQGIYSKETFYLNNDFIDKVDSLLITVPSGTTKTTEGDKPIRLEDYQYNSFLEGGGKTPITVTFDTRDLPVGIYQPILQATGKRSGKRISTSLVFQLTVVEGVTSPISNELKVEAPKDVRVGEEFAIKVTNKPADMEISFDKPYDLDSITVDRGTTTWEYTGKFRKQAKYLLHVNLNKYGVIMQTYDIEITAYLNTPREIGGSEIKLQFTPTDCGYQPIPLTLVGTTCTVRATDMSNYEIPATITVNGQNTDTYVPKQDTQYTILAALSGYATKTYTIQTTPNTLVFEFNPKSPKVGDKLSLSTTDTQGKYVASTIYANGAVYSGPILLQAGNYSLTATAPGFKQLNQEIVILPPYQILSMPTNPKLGKPTVIQLNRVANWRVTDGNQTIASGTGDLANFTLANIGTYEFYVADQKMTTLNPSAFFALSDFNMSNAWIIGLGAIFLLATLYYIGGKGTATTPKVPISKRVAFRPKSNQSMRLGFPEEPSPTQDQPGPNQGLNTEQENKEG